MNAVDTGARGSPRTAPGAEALGALALAGVALGLALHELAGVSLWRDEAELGLYVRDPDFPTGPPYYNAPVLHLLLLRALMPLGSDLALRLPSALAIAATVWLTIRALGAAGRSRWQPWIAGVLLATTPLLVHYGREIKQYGFEVLFTALLLWVLARGAPSALGRRRFWIGLAIASLVGALATFSWVAVLPALILALGVSVLFESGKRRAGARWLAGYATACLAAALLLYFALLQHQTRGSLVDYWLEHGGLYDRSAPFLPWVAGRLSELFEGVGATAPASWVAPALFAAGLARMAAERSWGLLAFCVAAPAIALAYAALGLYPFAGGRLTLFLFPLVFAPIAGALAWPLDALSAGRARVAVGVAGAALLAVYGVGAARDTLEHNETSHVEDVRTVLDVMRREWQPGDALLVYGGARWGFRYHSREGEFGEARRLRGRRKPRYYERKIDSALEDAERVWILFAHHLRRGDDTATIASVEARGDLRLALDESAVGARVLRVERVD